MGEVEQSGVERVVDPERSSMVENLPSSSMTDLPIACSVRTSKIEQDFNTTVGGEGDVDCSLSNLMFRVMGNGPPT